MTSDCKDLEFATRRSPGRRGRRGGLMMFASVIALASATHAAEAPSTVASTSAAADAVVGLSEVVVTAQKRAQDLQAVPISISAITGAKLSDERISDIEDLSRVVPGVSFDSSATAGTTNISIRGVSSQAGSATVGLYIDDVSITTKNFFYEGAIEPVIPDLDRIEVLRGPQGTLYGDSSEGGTIRFLSRAPDMNAYSGDVSLDTSNTAHGGENYAGGFSVNLPIVKDFFALRISGSSESDSGWIDHFTQDIAPDDSVIGGGVLNKRGVNSERIDTLHVTGKITPGDGWTITPSFFFQRQHVDDSSAFYIDTPGLGLFDQDKEVAEPGTDTLKLASLNIQKEFDFATITSITGLLQRTAQRTEDGTFFNSASFVSLLGEGTPEAVPLPNSTVPLTQALNILSNLASPVKLDTHYEQVTQEFRAASRDEGPDQHLHWVAGLYFAQQTIHNTDFQQIPGINTTFASLFGVPMEQTAIEPTFSPVAGTTLFPNDEDESDNRSYKEDQYSIYGQIDYDFLPQWHLGVGGRYEYATEHFVSVETGFYQIGNLGFTGYPPGTPITPYIQAASASSFTPKVSLSHDFSSNETVYASAGQGFRLGGPTGPITFGPTSVCNSDFQLINQTSQPTQFKSDSLWTYELGSKGRYFDNRVSVNVSGYYTDWRNIQQQIYLPDCGYYFTENVGDARIYGGELEAAFKITQTLTASASINGESATITRSVNPITVPVGSNLIDVPDGTFTGELSYSRAITEDVRLSAFINYEWIGHSNGSYQRFTNTVALGSLVNLNFNNPAYGVVNANVTLSRGAYDLSLYAKNLANDHTIIQTPEINTVYEGFTVHPRVIGVTLKAHF